MSSLASLIVGSADDEQDQKLFPDNSIVHLIVEVARAKRVYQHEDNSRTTSPFVESYFSNSHQLVKGWLSGGDAAAEAEKEMAHTPRRGKKPFVPEFLPFSVEDGGGGEKDKINSSSVPLIGVTKTVSESADPFFNQPFEFVFTPQNDVINQAAEATARFHFRVVDDNIHPHPRPLSLATVDINFSKNGKGELVLGCFVDPELSKSVAALSEGYQRTEIDKLGNQHQHQQQQKEGGGGGGEEGEEGKKKKDEDDGVWPNSEACIQSGSEGGGGAGANGVGTLIIRWSVKVTKPKPPQRDAEADIELLEHPKKLTGDSKLVPVFPSKEELEQKKKQEEEEEQQQRRQHQQGEEQTTTSTARHHHHHHQNIIPGPHMVYPGIVLFTDQDFTTKLNKAMIKILGQVHDEEVAARSPTNRRRQQRSNFGGSTRNAAPAEEEQHIDKVVTQYWNVKRSHQLHTKMRICAERCLKGEQALAFTPEEELEYKIRWKLDGEIRQVGLTAPQLANISSGLFVMLQKIWVLIVTGEDETEGSSLWTPGPDQRIKLQYIAWGPTQYCALQATMIKLVMPTLSDLAAFEIALEDLKADDEACEAMTPQPGSSRVVGSGLGSSPAAAATSPASSMRASRGGTAKEDPLQSYHEQLAGLEKTYAPVRGDLAFKIFTRQMCEFLHRWSTSFTETEQISLLKATAKMMEFCRFHSGLITEKPKPSRARRGQSGGRRGGSRRGRRSGNNNSSSNNASASGAAASEEASSSASLEASESNNNTGGEVVEIDANAAAAAAAGEAGISEAASPEGNNNNNNNNNEASPAPNNQQEGETSS